MKKEKGLFFYKKNTVYTGFFQRHFSRPGNISKVLNSDLDTVLNRYQNQNNLSFHTTPPTLARQKCCMCQQREKKVES